jgi:aryl-phospho-beta-D-glucosidase BglC (GH1 family)
MRSYRVASFVAAVAALAACGTTNASQSPLSDAGGAASADGDATSPPAISPDAETAAPDGPGGTPDVPSDAQSDAQSDAGPALDAQGPVPDAQARDAAQQAGDAASPIGPACASGDPFLAAEGTQIRDGHGTGDPIALRGANLGSWLLLEPWMAPVANAVDDNTMRTVLSSRFGDTMKDSLIAAYEGAWLESGDFDNMAALGMNVVRLPFWYLNLENADGSARPDAFAKLDWAVGEAWKRCIYTVLDLHGAPGSQNGNLGSGVQGPSNLWASSADKAHTVAIWQKVASHFAGNPAVAGYDLLNEPFGAPTEQDRWDMQDSLYKAVRGVDPDHIVMIEATWHMGNLPAPSMYGWTNVVYECHSYDWGTPMGADEGDAQKQMATADAEVQDVTSHASYNVPVFLGEFNVFGNPAAWKYTVEQWSKNGMSWATWSWRATAGGDITNAWGVYNPLNAPPVPSMTNDSAATILADWSRWNLTAFGLNPMLKPAMAMPVVANDQYNATAGVALTVLAPGILGNDKDLNSGGPGIALVARKVGDPAHGTLNLNADGSFGYMPSAGFKGTDTFRYSVFDGRIDSVRPGVVTIRVN